MAAPARLHVLVVDDNTDGREVLRVMLEDVGHRVTETGDGAEALRLALTTRPDVVVSDFSTPGLSGPDLARELRRHAPVDYRPLLVAFTGWARDEDRTAALAAGFDVYLVKPGDPEALLAAIWSPVPLP